MANGCSPFLSQSPRSLDEALRDREVAGGAAATQAAAEAMILAELDRLRALLDGTASEASYVAVPIPLPSREVWAGKE